MYKEGVAMKKERVDILLVEKGFFDSREKAKRAVMAGLVHDDYDRIDKPGTKINIESNLYVKGQTLKYVSRGGLKLEKAIELYQLDLKDQIMLDIGSSTGGFSDCGLQNGIKLVYALDVGTNQLAWKLRNDPRVIVMEQTNFRYVDIDRFDQGQPTFCSIDVSFISLKHIFPKLFEILSDDGKVVALIKPQFEAGREQVGKKGIIKDPNVHLEVLNKVLGYANDEGFCLQEITFSPITGGQGNIEFLGLFTKGKQVKTFDFVNLVFEASHYFGK